MKSRQLWGAFCVAFSLQVATIINRVDGIALKLKTTTINKGIVQLCGFRSEGNSVFGHNRIVGGKEADKHEFKWQVSMRSRKKDKHICGGAIIGTSWIVTAAHCTIDYSPSYLVFVAGDHSVRKDEKSEQRRRADMLIEHENYNSRTQENDIALVRVKEPYNFSTFKVAPVCLPTQKQNFEGDCVVTGWGKVKESGRNADKLQKVWMPIVPDAACKRRMKSLGSGYKVTNSMICGGLTSGGKDACQGDSGGPFVCPGADNLPMLVGVVSWGVGCARENVPGIYTEVPYFVNWINKKVKKFSTTLVRQLPEDYNIKRRPLNRDEPRYPADNLRDPGTFTIAHSTQTFWGDFYPIMDGWLVTHGERKQFSETRTEPENSDDSSEESDEISNQGIIQAGSPQTPDVQPADLGGESDSSEESDESSEEEN